MENLHLGTSLLPDSSKVTGEIVEHLRGSKVIVYKMKSKKKYREEKRSSSRDDKIIN